MNSNPIKDLLDGSYYYESKTISKTRKLKRCSICSSTIPVGSSHNSYVLFNEEYYSMDVCPSCEEKYSKEISEMKSNKYDSY